MAKPRLSEAQWKLLRKLPDAGAEIGGTISNRFPPATRRKLQEAGLIKQLCRSVTGEGSYFMGWVRTPASHVLLEAKDKRIADERAQASCEYVAKWTAGIRRIT